MQKWITDNLVALTLLCGTFALNLILMGSAYSTLRADVAQTMARVKTIEDQKVELTTYRVQGVEKRADEQVQINAKLVEKLDRITVMVERIDQRTTKP